MIRELQKTIHAINEEKGWHDEPLMTDEGTQTVAVLAKLALVHSELSEAFVEHEARRLDVYYTPDKPAKPEGFEVEIADALIRVLDTCEALSLRIEDAIAIIADTPRERATIARLHLYVSGACEAARIDDMATFALACAALWLSSFELCARYGLHLEAAIRLKIAYNRTRPFKHGGKLA